MTRKASPTRAASAKSPRTRPKAMLRPIVPAKAGEISLDYHMTLEALRSGVANQYHVGSMAQAIYMAMLLNQRGYGSAVPELFRDAEGVILRCRQAGLETGICVVDHDAYALLGQVLTLFDQQLAVTPVGELIAVNAKLKTLFSAANGHGDVDSENTA
ncbi:Fis family transcriptional regulator [Paraburkholderia youngii]|uniref:Fis family transcriptional regulator n=1 Tax=Paraburkholderia youngii TaxID=2782701 RepID=UPI003D1B1881